MKAAICTAYGPPEVLKIQNVLKPVPKANEILVKIKATAVNSGDVRVRGMKVTGFLKLMMHLVIGFTKPRKPILGVVFAGEVEETGRDVSLFKQNDKVFAITGFKFGCFAEYITVKENSAVEIMPRNATFDEAAAIVFGGSTATHFLQKVKLQPDQKVMIYGATGAVGTSAVQIAKHMGANVTAVCSAGGKNLADSLGADTVLDYTKDGWNDGHYDVVLDAVGKIKKNDVSSNKFLTVGGMEVSAETKAQLIYLRDMFENGQLKAAIDRTYTLDQIVAAHHYVDSERKKGNVVIQCSQ